MKYSLITIVNKEAVYKEFKNNLESQQKVNYELIRINNDHNQYDSARAAYNAALKKASGDYLVFLHPDIRFLDKFALHEILNQIIHLPNLGVAGIAGSPSELVNGDREILTTIVQGSKKETVGHSINRPTSVQTVDECFFVTTKQFAVDHPFSDIKGWHFYAVEQCLVALLNGKNNYVVPAHVWHTSAGASEDYHYVLIGMQMIKRYGNHFNHINTTVHKWDTKGVNSRFHNYVYLIKRIITTYLKKWRS